MTITRLRDIEARLGRNITGLELDSVLALRDDVEQQLEATLRRPIAATTITGERHLLEAEQTTLRPRKTPISAVSAIRLYNVVDGVDFLEVVVDPNYYVVTRMTVELRAILRPSAAIVVSPTVVQVDYTAGLTQLLPGYGVLRSVCAARIARIVKRAEDGVGGDTKAVQVEGYRLILAADSWSSHEMELIGTFKRRVAR